MVSKLQAGVSLEERLSPIEMRYYRLRILPEAEQWLQVSILELKLAEKYYYKFVFISLPPWWHKTPVFSQLTNHCKILEGASSCTARVHMTYHK